MITDDTVACQLLYDSLRPKSTSAVDTFKVIPNTSHRAEQDSPPYTHQTRVSSQEESSL